MTFPIEKRINTELFIGRDGGFIYKREIKNWIKKLSDLLEEGKTETAGKVKCRNENTAASLECLTLHGRKDKLTAACLKRLSLKSEKYRNAKK